MLIIKHELPKRLRIQAKGLAEVSPITLQGLLSHLSSIERIHLNAKAKSLVIYYDGQPLVRQFIINALQDYLRSPPKTLAISKSEKNLKANSLVKKPLGAIRAGLIMLCLPFLPVLWRRLLTWGLIAPRLWQGGYTLLNQGIKIEVLDSLAVGLSAFSGKYLAALTTYGLLELGEYFEHSTRRHSDELLKQLLKPVPGRVWVWRDDQLIELDYYQIVEGDCLEIGSGKLIPIDGKVIAGNASVNQASLTGETLPVRKESGDKVLSGSVIVEGRLTIFATRVGDDTTTARISRFIEHSLEQQSTTECLAEEQANKRVFLTLFLGSLVYAFTRDLQRLAAVFLVDYACALKLGTPVAMKAAMYHAAHQSLLFRSSQAIENLAKVDTVVFDKTGTLTTGVMKITDITSFNISQWPEAKLLALAASLEEHASHPIAEAIVQQAKPWSHIEHEEVDYLVAHGLVSSIDGACVVIGSRHFMEEHQGISFADHQEIIDQWIEQGKTILYIALQQKPLGLIALEDNLRLEAKQVIKALKKQGIKEVIMITGDQAHKAQSLQPILGLDAIYADCPPEEKAEIIKALRQKGQYVAFVGDGVNDAPALIAGDVGIAMPKGADLARATAEVVLLNDNLQHIVYAHQLSRRTLQLIKSHFYLSTSVNTAVIIGASFGWFRPALASFLHNGMTIAVLINAMRSR